MMNHKVLHSILNNGLDGIYKHVELELKKYKIHFENTKQSNLALSNNILTPDQQIPSILLESLILILRTNSRSTSNRVMVGQFINHHVSDLIIILLQNYNCIHSELIISSFKLIYLMIQVEPENYSFIENSGLISTVIQCIINMPDEISSNCFMALCDVIRYISLHENGRKEIISSGVIRKMFLVLYYDDPNIELDTTIKFSTETLCELVNHYKDDYKKIIVKECMTTLDRFKLFLANKLFQEENKKKQQEEQQKQQDLENQENQENQENSSNENHSNPFNQSKYENFIFKFAVFSANMYDCTDLFTNDQKSHWIESSIEIFISRIPDNIFNMERYCIHFFATISEDDLPILFDVFARLINEKFKKTFPSGVFQCILDPKNADHISLCYLMSYFITIFERLDNYHVDGNLANIITCTYFIQCISNFLDVFRCIIWHSSVQTIEQIKFDFNEKKNQIKKKKKEKKKLKNSSSYPFDCFYMNPDGIHAIRTAFESVIDVNNEFKDLTIQSVTKLFEWANINYFYKKTTTNNEDNDNDNDNDHYSLSMIQYLSRILSYFRMFLFNEPIANLIFKKIEMINSFYDFEKILNFCFLYLFDSEYSLAFKILSNENHPLRCIYLDMITDSVLEFIKICDSLFIFCYCQYNFDHQIISNIIKFISSNVFQSLWKPDQFTFFPNKVIDGILCLYRSITEPNDKKDSFFRSRSRFPSSSHSVTIDYSTQPSTSTTANNNNPLARTSDQNAPRLIFSSDRQFYDSSIRNISSTSALNNTIRNQSNLSQNNREFRDLLSPDTIHFQSSSTSTPSSSPSSQNNQNLSNKNNFNFLEKITEKLKRNSIFNILDCVLTTKEFNGDEFIGLLKSTKSKDDCNNFINYYCETNNNYLTYENRNTNEYKISNIFQCFQILSNEKSSFRLIIYKHIHPWILSSLDSCITNKIQLNSISNWITNGISLISSFCSLPNENISSFDSRKKLKNQQDFKIFLLSPKERILWLEICLYLLQNTIISQNTNTTTNNLLPLLTNPSKFLYNCINLLSKLLTFYDISKLFIEKNGLEILFHHENQQKDILPDSPFLIDSKYHSLTLSSIQSLLRHITESSMVLQVAMENEICFLLKFINRGLRPKEFLHLFALLALRDKDIFFKASLNCCQMKDARIFPFSKSSDEFFSQNNNNNNNTNLKNQENSNKIFTRRLKVPLKNSNEFLYILRLLSQLLIENYENEKNSQINDHHDDQQSKISIDKMQIDHVIEPSPSSSTTTTTTTQQNDKDKKNEKYYIYCNSFIINYITDLITNFPQCSPILLESSPISSNSTIIHFLLSKIIIFPRKAIEDISWVAKEKDICLLGARLIIALWGTKDGRKKILFEICKLCNDICIKDNRSIKQKTTEENNNNNNKNEYSPISIHELCSIYALSELLKILLKLRKSKEFCENIASLCVRSKIMNHFVMILNLIDLDFTFYYHVIASIVNTTKEISRLIVKYHKPSSSSSSSLSSNQPFSSVPSSSASSHDKNSQNSSQSESTNDLLSYFESVDNNDHSFDFSNLSDDDNQVMDDVDDEIDDDDEDTQHDITHHHEIIVEEDDDDDEEEMDDNDDEDDDEMDENHHHHHGGDHDDDDDDNLHFSDSDSEENPWEDGFITDFFLNLNEENHNHLPQIVWHHIRESRERMRSIIIRDFAPFRNINRTSSMPQIRSYPSVQHSIRKIFNRTIPNFLFKRWSRWIDPDCTFTSNIIAFSLSLEEPFIQMFNIESPDNNNNKNNSPSNSKSVSNRPDPTDEPPLKNKLFSLRGGIRSFLEELANDPSQTDPFSSSSNNNNSNNNNNNNPNTTRNSNAPELPRPNVIQTAENDNNNNNNIGNNNTEDMDDDPMDIQPINNFNLNEQQRISVPQIEVTEEQESSSNQHQQSSVLPGAITSSSIIPDQQQQQQQQVSIASTTSPSSTAATSVSTPNELPEIDMNVLNELPEDIRQEILDSRRTVEQLMNRAPVELPEGVNQEYFDALPPDLQAEVLAQVEIQNRRRERRNRPLRIEDNNNNDEEMNLMINNDEEETQPSTNFLLPSMNTNETPTDHHSIVIERFSPNIRLSPLRTHGRRRFQRVFSINGNEIQISRSSHSNTQEQSDEKLQIHQDYEGLPLLSLHEIQIIIKLLYWNTPKISIPKLCKNLFYHPTTRLHLISMFIYMLTSHYKSSNQNKEEENNHFYNFKNYNQLKSITNDNFIEFLDHHLSYPFIQNSLLFLPLKNPNHPQFGLEKNSSKQILLTNYLPKSVFQKILNILLYLSKSNTKKMEKIFFSNISLSFFEKINDSVQYSSLINNFSFLIDSNNNNHHHCILPIANFIEILKDDNIIHSQKNFVVFILILHNLTKNIKEYNSSCLNYFTASTTIDISINEQNINPEMEIDNNNNNEQQQQQQQTENENSNDNNSNENNSNDRDVIMNENKILFPELPFICSKYILDALQYSICNTKILFKYIQVINKICSNENNQKNLLNQFQILLKEYIIKESEYLLENYKKLKENENHQEKQLSIFLSTSQSSNSEILLRIITCYICLFPNELEKTENLLSIMSEKSGGGIWQLLFNYCEIIQSFFKLEMVDHQQLSISTVSSLQCIIESFFIFHFNIWPSDEKAFEIESHYSMDKKIEFTKENILYSFIFHFSEILNCILKQSSKLILKGSFSKMILFPSLLSFDVKRKYFQKILNKKRLQSRQRGRGIKIRVRRNDLFEDSFQKMRNLTADDLKNRLSVQFEGEQGVDAGGLLKDWYQELSKQIFNPNYALFIHSPDHTFQPNKDSSINPHHLDFFKFCGRIIGKAIFDGAHMDIHFTRSFYKHILGKPIVWKDIEAVDPEYFKNLKWLLENQDISSLDLFFTVESNSFGHVTCVDLIPNGSHIQVTEDNKHDYVQLIANYKMTQTIEKQISAFKDGFYELIPHRLISIFNELELELLISGLPDIDVQDMKRNTEYRGYTEDSPVIRFFWNIVINRFCNSDRALLLQFVTGSSQVPLDGFAALQGMNGLQKFRIVRTEDIKRLPTAHTW